MMGVTAHKASERTREAANAAVERAEAALRAAQDKLQAASGQARPLGLTSGCTLDTCVCQACLTLYYKYYININVIL